MSYAIDTNVLARSVEADHPMQGQALDAIAALVRAGESVCVLAQNFYEFWVIATRPREQNGLGVGVAEAEAFLARFESTFRLKADTAAIYSEWRRIVKHYSVKGKQAHDARIVAAMKVHAITHLLTFNSGDFKRYPEITAAEPKDIIPQSSTP
ncbi:MAG TPA: type II toxin-antitoxin system VapC family toxin [Blastocatellia bacterium]|nr:type II toxin-antitoxin system VapC family toxin [Blastocatellia bacterium]